MTTCIIEKRPWGICKFAGRVYIELILCGSCPEKVVHNLMYSLLSPFKKLYLPCSCHQRLTFVGAHILCQKFEQEQWFLAGVFPELTKVSICLMQFLSLQSISLNFENCTNVCRIVGLLNLFDLYETW